MEINLERAVLKVDSNPIDYHVWSIYIPGTQMTLVLVGKGLVLEG